MLTDFERELSELLHTVTPEPPDHLASPRIATLPEARPVADDATVIELVTGTQHAASRRHRWSALLAAAAVAALAGGVVALTQLGNSGHRAPQRVGTAPPTNTPTTNVGLPQCRNSQTVISQGPQTFATHGSSGAAHMAYQNKGAQACALTLTSVTIGPDTTGGTPFPGSAQTFRIPGHGQVIVSAHVRVSGQCQTVRHGLRINLIQGGWTYSSWLGVSGCTLTPQRVTHRVAN